MCAFTGEKFGYEYFEEQCKRNELHKQEYAKKPIVCPCEVGPVRSRWGITDPLIEVHIKVVCHIYSCTVTLTEYIKEDASPKEGSG
jgi:hypothetical protein